MDIRQLLIQIAERYDRTAGTGKDVPGQQLLRKVSKMEMKLPRGLRVEGNGGKGTAARSPWIGVFDPGVSDDSREGLYLAYIYSSDMESVSLTLQQGIEKLAESERDGSKLGRGGKLREAVSDRAHQIRALIPVDIIAGWDPCIDLKARSEDWRPRAYEAGNVLARRYRILEMPEEEVLRGDLWRAAEILRYAASIERDLWRHREPERLHVSYQGKPRHDPAVEKEGLEGFKPKDSGSYVVEIKRRVQYRSRSHEELINGFALYIERRGFTPVTVGMHPRDLVLRKLGQEWLVEAKVVKDGNPTKAVREAVGQILEYRYFLHSKKEGGLGLVGLFTEDIGVFAEYMESQGIASIWRTADGAWEGSVLAHKWGLTEI
ncbi:DUF3578 domain-containing protein [Streptomyces verrucosisporus]|uniref:MrcB family domain-containing protein n=1 Tax=Streptomyces verrucosisporus TaxID=1695161 RepID=UPI0019D0FF1B|nr:DUF3578 domain-containing protein [Streptomyces verrucosisporus]MBN3932063.1 DUF3578 domain-containing protein [Streptomyces verrucosisporus]